MLETYPIRCNWIPKSNFPVSKCNFYNDLSPLRDLKLIGGIELIPILHRFASDRHCRSARLVWLFRLMRRHIAPADIAQVQTGPKAKAKSSIQLCGWLYEIAPINSRKSSGVPDPICVHLHRWPYVSPVGESQLYSPDGRHIRSGIRSKSSRKWVFMPDRCGLWNWLPSFLGLGPVNGMQRGGSQFSKARSDDKVFPEGNESMVAPAEASNCKLVPLLQPQSVAGRTELAVSWFRYMEKSVTLLSCIGFWS